MKQCTTCKQLLDLTAFGIHARDKSGVRCECKQCRSIKSKLKRQKYTKIINEIKTQNPCSDCNKFYPAVAMQFDHVRDKKEFTISWAVGILMKWDKILKEIAKCDIVCANCHAVRTWS